MLSQAQELVSTIIPQLKRGEILPAIKVIAPWLSEMRAAGMSMLLEFCPQDDLPRMVALLRDLVDDYPKRLMAVPVLICARPDGSYPDSTQFSATYPPNTETFFLPCEGPEGQEPGDEISFLGWVNPTTTSPIPRRELLEEPRLGIQWGMIAATVALFEWSDSPWGDQTPTLDGMWLAQLMAGTGIDLCMTTLEASDFPTAAETARVMLAASNPSRSKAADPADSCFFLTEVEYKKAKMEGARFGRICDRDCPEHRGRRVA